jgi:tRNA dimethylallyltransferase
MAAGGEPLLALVGPTASGKTLAAISLAERLGAEIVSVDSMLVYRGMDVGTAKPTPAERARVPHHLIDVAEPSEPFSVAIFQSLARQAVGQIRSRGRRVLLAGGTVLYFRAVVDDLSFPATDPNLRGELEREAERVGAHTMYERLAASDPVAASKIEAGNVRRIVRALEVAELTSRPFSSFASEWDRYEPERVRVAGVHIQRDLLWKRIEARVTDQLENGALDEVRALLHRGLGGWLTSSQAIGYAEFAQHLTGGVTLDDAVEAIVKRTKALARRQLAFLRRDPRIRWFEAGADGAGALVDDIAEYLDA